MENYEKHLSQIGAKIASARHESGEKETTVAKAIGVSDAVISLIENGRYKSLKLKTILALCHYYKIPMHELFLPGRDDH